MRESRTLGSVRGAVRKDGPYRDYLTRRRRGRRSVPRTAMGIWRYADWRPPVRVVSKCRRHPCARRSRDQVIGEPAAKLARRSLAWRIPLAAPITAAFWMTSSIKLSSSFLNCQLAVTRQGHAAFKGHARRPMASSMTQLTRVGHEAQDRL